MTEISNFDYKISFRIIHPNIDPNEITEKIGFLPDRSAIVGDQRYNPSGRKIAGTHRSSSWVYSVANEKIGGRSLASAIKNFNRRIAHCQDFFDLLVKSGGKIEYFVGWFSGRNSGEDLEWALLHECSHLRIGIALDIYSDDEFST